MAGLCAITHALVAALVLSTPSQGARLLRAQGQPMFGWYIHAYEDPAAVMYQVRKIHELYPSSPVYIMSDGGMDFEDFCKQENCMFKLCPPANDRWHPWPFMRRMYDAALAMDVKYVVLLEPDNTIHGPIKYLPDHDAGGIDVPERGFAHKEYIEEMAQARKPGFNWTKRSMNAGLAGGSYFKREAILDAFNDEAVAKIDWEMMAAKNKNILSSDFAMPYALAARGWEAWPWQEVAQMEQDPNIPVTGARDAAFRHYGRGFPGGKPTYNMRLQEKDAMLVKPPLHSHRDRTAPRDDPKSGSPCQMCYNLQRYIKDWGSAQCTNRKFTKVIKPNAANLLQLTMDLGERTPNE